MGKGYEKKARNLILVFGDQLNAGSAAFDGFDTAPKSYDGQIRHDHSGLSVCDPVTSASLKAFKRRLKA